MNHISKLLTSQLNPQKSLINRPQSLLKPQQKHEFKHVDIDSLISRWSVKRLKVLRFITTRWSKRTCGNDTYQYIALACRVKKITVRRVLEDLRAMGLAFWDNVQTRANNYFLSPFLFSESVSSKLMKALTIVGIFTLSFLISKPAPAAKEHHLTYKEFNFIKSKQVRESHSTHARAREGRAMKQEPLLTTIRKELQLQEEDLPKILIFPSSALDHSLSKLLAAQKKQVITNKLGYFIATAKGYCLDRGIPMHNSFTNTYSADADAQPEYKPLKREDCKPNNYVAASSKNNHSAFPFDGTREERISFLKQKAFEKGIDTTGMTYFELTQAARGRTPMTPLLPSKPTPLGPGGRPKFELPVVNKIENFHDSPDSDMVEDYEYESPWEEV